MTRRPLLLPRRTPALLLPLALALGGAACERSDERRPDVAAAPPGMEISGRYDVKGLTTTPGTMEKRAIQGSIIIVQEGDGYTATYELGTTWPTEGTSTDADVLGVGEGRIDRGTLTGTAQTQLVISSVPGVDTGFAFVPRMVTTRIVSDTVARIAPDGRIEIEIESRAAPGEQYEPTRTRMTGRRVPMPGDPRS